MRQSSVLLPFGHSGRRPRRRKIDYTAAAQDV
ncbi:hypothetical protein EU555_33410 [Methylobacterium nonmethylotrophicum]|uniref:Histone chaperone domain-containing protein n=1 Tax=Methylobacterium nonmethylotrophicum TaxID=1141884 RepID=A0A4Z0NDM4_9HYPH|nr:hypothetical protein EU555_33410 [Methylobacterium nonmethylotrophicum]